MEAIEWLARAVAAEPNDAATQLKLGIALQGVGRHADALRFFTSAQKSLSGDPAPFLHAAMSQLSVGNAAAALPAASEACYRAPESPHAHYVYGQAWTALSDSAAAERAFAEAIRLSPQWPDAWVNYGIARYRQGAVEDAKTAMRQVLAFAPGHAAASANLGAFMRISGEIEGGEALLRATVANAPGNMAARLNMVAELLQEERSGEALALLDEAAPPTSTDLHALRHWYLHRSLALLQLQRFDEARQILGALAALGTIPPEIAPMWFRRQLLLALGDGDRAGARAAADAMETALECMGPDAVPEHRVMSHYDLAKFWSGNDAPSRAFAHWTTAHKLLSVSQPFSREAHRAFVDENIKRFTGARFATGPRARNQDPAPVFIVGMPRSGTTLCEQILAAHAQVHGAGERSALPHAFYALGGHSDQPDAVQRIANLGSPPLDEAASHYLAALHALAPDKARIVDKLPGNFNYLGVAGLMLPGAKYIHCTRDPRDIGLSIFTFRFYGVHAYAHDLADLGWYITEHDRLMAHWKAAMPGAILTVQLSDWVTDFDGTLAKVLKHLDLPPDSNCARFYENDSHVRTVSRAQVRQPVNSRGLDRWREYESELRPLIAELGRSGSLPSP